MKRFIIITCCAIALVVVFYSCTRFPAFPVELRAFFPYSENEKISFRNENDSIVKFNIEEIIFSEKHTTVGFVKCCKDESHMEFHFRNIQIVENNEISDISGLLSARPAGLKFTLSISGWGTSMNFSKEYNGNPYEESFAKEVGDTIRLSNEYGEAIFVKNKGLVKFTRSQSFWSLVE